MRAASLRVCGFFGPIFSFQEILNRKGYGSSLPSSQNNGWEPFVEDAMPIYISRGRYTAAAVKSMLAKPENREQAVAKLFKRVGGKLIGWYLTFGHHDWMAIGEFPDEKAAASAILAAAAGGSLSDIETTIAMTAKDAAATFGSAGKAAKEFRSAGRS
jgi:uncharacterized protein with GYD domain